MERFQNRKTGGLAACLAFHAGQWLPRDWLIEHVWPDLPVDNARACLRVSLHSLRSRLEPPGVTSGSVILASRTDAQIIAAAIVTDVREFERHIAETRPDPSGNSLQALLQLYQGPLLPGAYEDWITAERARLEQLFVDRVAATAEPLMEQGRAPLALSHLLEALFRAPHAEELHRRLLVAYRMTGRERDALTHFRGLREQSRVGWGCELPPEISSVVADLLGSDMKSPSPKRARRRPPRPPRPSRMPIDHSLPQALPSDSQRSRLPGSLSRFCGRIDELSILGSRLAPGCDGTQPTRLITLTGSPGSGKSRLALEAARRASPRYGNRVAYVRLSEVRQIETVTAAILRAIPAVASGDPVAEISRAVGENPLLLVLDNIENVRDICAELLPRLLLAADRLTILATSRVPLDIEGECLLPVQPLPVPPHSGGPDRLLEFASVEMFVDRAQQARPSFQLTPGNAATVTSVCQILEGVPLAIELAAARLSSLTPQQILSELDNRFNFLVSKKRPSDSCHSTLEEAIGWSYSLLEPNTRHFFTRLAVFRGGWTLEAARAVWRDRPDDGLDHLDSLVRRSLVIAEEAADSGDCAPSMRYRMLDSLREFAESRQSAEDTRIGADLAAAYYLGLAERWGPLLRGARSVEATTVLAGEIPNLRESWRRLRASSTGLRLVTAVWRLWIGQGLDAEGYAMLAGTLSANENMDPALRCAAHLGAGMLAYYTGQFERADRHAEEASGLSCRADSDLLRGEALGLSGILAGDSGDIDGARRMLEESVQLRGSAGDAWGVASALNNLARLAVASKECNAAGRLYNEAFETFRSVGDLTSAATAMMNIGVMADAQHDYRSARVAYERAIDLVKRSGNPHDLGILYYNLGEAMHRDSAHPYATVYLLESLRLHKQQGRLASIPYPLAALANAAGAAGDDWRAVQLHAAASALRLKLQTPMTPASLELLHADVDALRRRCRAEDFDVAWRLGAAMTIDDAIACARREIEPTKNPIPPAPLAV